MFVRLLNLVVIVGLICAAAYVYDIKYETTRRAQRETQLRIDLRREREAVASLRAQWARLENPARIEDMAKRHLTLKFVQPYQFGNIERVPERAPDIVQPDQDLIGAMLEHGDAMATGSVGAAKKVKTTTVTAAAAGQRQAQ